MKSPAATPVPVEGLHSNVSDAVRLEVELVAPAAAGDAASNAPRGARTILLVGDDLEMRRYLKQCLVGSGHRSFTTLDAADGTAALERLRRGGIHLVISDISAPHTDGLALLAAMQADPALRALPVLLLTGEPSTGDPPPGAAGMLGRPFNAETLWAHVRPLLP